MALTDPQTVTVNAVPHVLSRTGSGENTGAFTQDDGSYSMIIKQSPGKRNRRMLRFYFSKVAVDPMVPTQNAPYSGSITITVDTPPVGYTVADIKQQWDGLLANLAATSGLNTTKFLSGES